MSRSLWKTFFNLDTIGYICLFLIVVYTWYSNRGKSHNARYMGIGDDGWDFSQKFWRYGVDRSEQSPKRPIKEARVNKHEERCREIFEDIFGRRFISTRPGWLKNPATGKNLELDGFCSTIKTPIGKGLAFEYDGAQHSEYNKHFHRGGPKEFEYQTKKDTWKDIRCKQEGVLLVRIPHFVAFQDLDRYIKNRLNQLKVLPNQKRKLNIDSVDGFLDGLYH